MTVYIGINIFLAVIWWGVLDIRERVKLIEKRLEEKEKAE